MGIQEKEKAKTEIIFDWSDSVNFYDEILTYPEEKQSHKWSVSWSDLMMTMFIFFAVMYIYQVGEKDLKFGNGPGKNHLSENGSNTVINIDANQKPLDIYDQTKKAIREIMVDPDVDINLRKDDAVRIVLASDLFFNSGNADLKIGAKYQLSQIAKVLNENRVFINVVGHTDDMPTRSERYPTNWELSSKRAVTVARYLIEKKKIDANRIFISAHSSQQPIRPNDTSYNRSLNRRVEIILVKQKPYAVKPKRY
ncbi:MAG: OmpA family protein [Desulfobacula sp.]|nr:OmpA family protein [Desulfobacula sp.]